MYFMEVWELRYFRKGGAEWFVGLFCALNIVFKAKKQLQTIGRVNTSYTCYTSQNVLNYNSSFKEDPSSQLTANKLAGKEELVRQEEALPPKSTLIASYTPAVIIVLSV